MIQNNQLVVIVTGASNGLGIEISKTLVDAGFYVVGISRNVSEEFLALSENHRQFFEFDLTNHKEIPGLVNKIIKSIGGSPYGLVNNAGVGLGGVLATQHASDISYMLKLNLESPITLTKYVVRHMLKVRRGRIINISSIIGKTGFNGLAVYAASKSGLEGFTRSLSREVGKAGITVNCIAPGYMLTNMTKELSLDKLKSIKRRAPLGLPETLHAAHAVNYFLDPKAEKTTGIVLTVDGGSTA